MLYRVVEQAELSVELSVEKSKRSRLENELQALQTEKYRLDETLAQLQDTLNKAHDR